MNKQKLINERKNVFPASDWFDLNFLSGFLHSDLNIVKQFNQQTYTIGEEKLSSRVLNHWYQSGIITDDRLDNKGWKKFSFSEIFLAQKTDCLNISLSISAGILEFLQGLLHLFVV